MMRRGQVHNDTGQLTSGRMMKRGCLDDDKGEIDDEDQTNQQWGLFHHCTISSPVPHNCTPNTTSDSVIKNVLLSYYLEQQSSTAASHIQNSRIQLQTTH